MRTFDRIESDIKSASAKNDVEAMRTLAAEMMSLGTAKAEGRSHATFARLSISTGESPKAMEHGKQALELFEELGDRAAVAEINGTLGIALLSMGEYPAGLEFLNRALDVHEELEHQPGIASVSGNLGSAYLYTGDFPRALECYRRALDIHNSLGSLSGVATISGNIGNVYNTMGDIPEALKRYDEALKMKEELGDQQGVTRTTVNIGFALMQIGEYQKALEQFRRGRELQEDFDKPVESRSVNGVVAALLALEEYQEAAKILNQLEGIHHSDPAAVSGDHFNRAKLLEHQGDIEGAAARLQQALLVAANAGLRSEEVQALKELRDLAQRRGDFPGYIEFNDKYTRVTEEINGKEVATKIAMQAKQREIDAERRETEKYMAVLNSTLPKHIADRVARGEAVSDNHENATVIFLDIVGFTTHSSSMESSEVTSLLAGVFEHFDALCDEHNGTKIKTIGDSYMAVGYDDIAASAALALAMNASEFSWPDGSPLQFRIGIHLGPVTAGVIGTQRLQYDVWGDTVNVASRMESSGEAGKIQVSEEFVRSSAQGAKDDSIAFVERGEIEIKGKGSMKTFWLEGAT